MMMAFVLPVKKAKEKEKVIDWKSRKKSLEDIFDNFRLSKAGKYDCIVPVSGEKIVLTKFIS